MDPDLADEWLFESMKSYESLYMYDLQQPVITGDWVSQQGLCVCISDGKKHEVLELSLPDKLLSHQNNEGLLKDRDFRVETGGFLDFEIVQICHINNTRSMVTSIKDKNSIKVLQVGGTASNLISSKLTIHNNQPSNDSAVFGLLSGSHVVFGSKMSDLTMADIETGSKIATITGDRTPDKNISAVCPMDKNLSLVCEKATGNVHTLDSRDKNLTLNFEQEKNSSLKITNSNQKDSEAHWTMYSSCDQNKLYQLSNQGELRFLDRRNLSKAVTSKTDLKSSSESIGLKCSPCGSYLSVSGFDGNVHLFSTLKLESESKVDTIFRHEGHVANTDQSELRTTVNLWHSNQSDLVLSGAMDGSLHAWRPVLG
ncbi:hypothetical protein LOTGIDRAFT_230022 [Lottia gigantea]|uniref:Anaphase-promoting complex subunit 4 WD40 domain-containing protein n=1 Tax=Lottia gigantea TaxID=225164 RepID=V4BBL9_LOTGI|nr:hypothetical protein LOTGIDRAFT_230022 [Lottia gigantea]ESP04961.1 hypothetical protein LOTGIDRAFT_230022 [Lottia gigantea]